MEDGVGAGQAGAEPDVVEEHREDRDEVVWHREESNQGKRIRMSEW